MFKSIFLRQELISLIFLIGGFLTFLPILQGYTMKDTVLDSFPKSFHSLQSMKFHDSLVTNIAASTPILLDLIFDLVLTGNVFHPKSPPKLSILLLIIPDLLILTLILPNKQYDILLSLLLCRDTLYIFTNLSYISNVAEATWGRSKIWLIGGCFLYLNIYYTYSHFIPFSDGLNNFAWAVLFLAFVFYFYNLIQWVVHFFKVMKANKRNDSEPESLIDLKLCNLHILFFTIFLIGDWFPSFLPSSYPATWISGMGLNYVSLYSYLMAACTISSTVVSARFALIEHTSSTLATRRMFLRYIAHEIRNPLHIVSMGLKLLHKDLVSLKPIVASLTLPTRPSASLSFSPQALVQSQAQTPVQDSQYQRKLRQQMTYMVMNGLGDQTPTPSDAASIQAQFEKKKQIYGTIKDCSSTIQEIQLSCASAVDILNEMLLYEKIETKILQLDKNYLSPQSLVQDSVNAHKLQAREFKVELLFQTHTSPTLLDTSLSILGDQNKLVQVLQNLLGNALKYSNEGGRVEVSLDLVAGQDSDKTKKHLNRSTSFSAGGGRNSGCLKYFSNLSFLSLTSFSDPSFSKLSQKRVLKIMNHAPVGPLSPAHENDRGADLMVLKVKDSGVGISKENQTRLFREVVEFNPGRLEGGSGSGLGLFISKSIVDMHGGTLSVYSEGEGLGSTFTLCLPLIQDKFKQLLRKESPTPSVVTDDSNMGHLFDKNYDSAYMHLLQDPDDPPQQMLDEESQLVTKDETNWSDPPQNTNDLDTLLSGLNKAIEKRFDTSPLPSLPFPPTSDCLSPTASSAETTSPIKDSKKFDPILSNPLKDLDSITRRPISLPPLDPSTKRVSFSSDDRRSIDEEVLPAPRIQTINEAFSFHGLALKPQPSSSKMAFLDLPPHIRSSLDTQPITPKLASEPPPVPSQSLTPVLSPHSVLRQSHQPFVSPVEVPLHILVVDDSHLNRKLLCRLLSNPLTSSTKSHVIVCNCYHAEDGKVAVDLVENSIVSGRSTIQSTAEKGVSGLREFSDEAFDLEAVPDRFNSNSLSASSSSSLTYDVILMDYQMPRMNGVEAIRRIRGLGFSGLVLGLTGNALQNDINNMMEAGADCVLTKPVDMRKLQGYLKVSRDKKIDGRGRVHRQSSSSAFEK